MHTRVVFSPHFRYFLLLLLLIGAPFFFWGGPGYYSSRSFQAAWDTGHIFYFMVFTYWLHQCLRTRGKEFSPPAEFFFIFFIVLFLGITVEVLQTLGSSRSPDMGDVVRNQLGCLLVYSFIARTGILARYWLRICVRFGVVSAILIAVWPLTRALIDEYLARQQFPVLADFETPFERYRWNHSDQLQTGSDIVRHGHRAARVQLSTNQYSGVALFYFPHDWRGFQTLHFSVYNPKKTPLMLNARIHDVHHKKHGLEYSDRYNQGFDIESGWNDLVIPLDKVAAAPKGRTMDMQHIEGFGLFVIQQPCAQVIYLDNVYLGPSPGK
ncbi:VanZ family protein [Desulfobulbus oligotrophicus]